MTSGSEEEVVEQHRPQVRLPADGYRYTEKKQKECDGPLYEAALYASRPASPDYAYFCHVRDRIDGQRALLSGARKLARRCYHTLRDLGDDALLPAA